MTTTPESPQPTTVDPPAPGRRQIVVVLDWADDDLWNDRAEQRAARLAQEFTAGVYEADPSVALLGGAMRRRPESLEDRITEGQRIHAIANQEALALVGSDLAHLRDPFDHGEPRCPMCGETARPHLDTCLWLRARRVLDPYA